jgi:hypothetical protein
METLNNLLLHGLDSAPAISAPARVPLTFGSLRALIALTIEWLNAVGIGCNDRVAVVLENGPVMATTQILLATREASI